MLLCCRRLTIEWVLRRVVTAEPGVTWRGGVGVAGLVADGHRRPRPAARGRHDGRRRPGRGRRRPQLAGDGRGSPTSAGRPAGRGVERGRHRLPVALLPAPRGSGAAGAHRRRAPVAISATSAFAGFYGDNRHVLDHVRRADGRPRADGPARRGRVGGGDPDARPARAVDRGRPRRSDHRRRVDGAAARTGSDASSSTASRSRPGWSSSVTPPSPPTRGTARAARWRASRPRPCRRRSPSTDATGSRVALAMDEAMRTEMEPHYALSCRQDADRIKLHTAHAARAPSPTPPRRRRGTSSSTASSRRLASTPTCSGRSSARSTCSTTRTPCWPTRVVLTAAGDAHATKDQRPPLPELGPPRDELLGVMAAAAD